jgi:hypothetical protein
MPGLTVVTDADARSFKELHTCKDPLFIQNDFAVLVSIVSDRITTHSINCDSLLDGQSIRPFGQMFGRISAIGLTIKAAADPQNSE